MGCLGELRASGSSAWSVPCLLSFRSQGGESLTSSTVSSRGRAKHGEGPARLPVVFFMLQLRGCLLSGRKAGTSEGHS